MPINKIQRSDFESYGQLYVGTSREARKNNLYIFAPTGKIRNIIYKEVVCNGTTKIKFAK